MNIKKPYIIGMIHLPPTMSYEEWPGMDEFVAKAVKDLKALEAGGAHAALIENDEDTPCKVYGTHDVVVPMTVVCRELSRVSKIPLGVEVLLNDPKASLSIAKAAELDFIRTDYFVDRMTREGYGEFEIDPQAIVAYRKSIGAENIKIFADIQVKYATMLQKKPISQSALEAIEAGADGVVVTGKLTGSKPVLNDLKETKKALPNEVPVFVGSGFDETNAIDLLEWADGAIVGTSIKTGRYIDEEKTKRLMKACFL